MAANHSIVPFSARETRDASLQFAVRIADRVDGINAMLDDLPRVTLAKGADADAFVDVEAITTMRDLAAAELALESALLRLANVVERETARFDRLGRPEAA